MKKLGILLGMLISITVVNAQSFELLTGNKRIFIDAQYLKFFDEHHKLSLFSRARATAEYDDTNTDLFTGIYVNYTTKSGFGGTVLGRVSSFSSGIDLGIHFFKANQKFMVYALPSINLNNELLYSWFSILRFTPELKKDWKIYSSLELFSAFAQQGHLSSVQRARIGLDIKHYQFGIGVNLGERGNRFQEVDINAGIFFRKQF